MELGKRICLFDIEDTSLMELGLVCYIGRRSLETLVIGYYLSCRALSLRHCHHERYVGR